MKPSLNAWTFPASTSTAQMVREASAAGFEALEPVIAEQGELTFSSCEQECRHLARVIRDAGLEVASLASGVTWQYNLGSPDSGVQARARELILSSLDRAAWLGAPVFLVVPAVVGGWRDARPSTSYADVLSRCYDQFRRLAGEAEARGVAIGIENVLNRFLLSPVETRELIDRVNSPYVGVYFDTGNVMPFGYPRDWIDTLAGRILRVHVKDYRLGDGDRQGGSCPLGEGDVDWPAVVTALARVGYDGPLTYEGPGEPGHICRKLREIISLVAPAG
ncbi:MAG TPA: sugar phosphate isomerase/epimerase family protein [Phycisphaerae bacterium]|nr:sugar phosphate isomerase/epimerase family protein [Phycisphaerae bacterium]